MSIPVILDTDIGSDIDDTWALAMLLRCPELDLKLVLSDTGNTVYRARVAAKLLDVAGRADVPVGVGLPFEAAHEYQAGFVEGYALDDYPGVVHQDGVQALIDLVRQSPEPVTIIAIGPSPNLERALALAPDIAGKCRLAGMFGSVDRGYGDGSSPVPETNVRVDVSAARAVFAAPWQEIVITPLDTCDQVIIKGEQYMRLLAAQDPLMQAVIENYRIWGQGVTWVHVDFTEICTSTLFDTVAVYLAYSQEYLHVEPMRLRVTDAGMTVRDDAGDLLNVAMHWRNLPAFKAHLVERLLSAE